MTTATLVFAGRLAWRETRAAWRSFASFLVCVTLGVGSLTAVGTLGANLDRTLAREAKALLGGDLEVRSTRPLDAATEAEISRLEAAGATVARVRELVAMARDPASGRSLLVELKSPGPSYPLYGRLEVNAGSGPSARPDGGSPAGRQRPPSAGGAVGFTTVPSPGTVVVGPELLERLATRVGGRLALGARELTIAGVVTSEPDRPSTIAALGPRVILTPGDLEATGLVRFGSRVRERVLFRTPPSTDVRRARAALAAAAPDAAVRVVAYDDAQPGLRRFFGQLTSYLGLVGLVSLLVGGIGVASSITTFLRRRVVALAVLKTLGAESQTLLLAYLLQAGLLGLGGSVLGAVLGVAVQPLLVWALSAVLPFALPGVADAPTVLRAVAMGVAVTFLSALWPLARLSAVKPSAILRLGVEPRLPGVRRPWPVVLPTAAGLAALACWQAGSLTVGAIFVGASLTALGVLAVLGRLVAHAGRAASAVRGPVLRHALANLDRPGAQSVGVVVALGVGVMLLVSVALLERGLLNQIDHERRREAPSFFFIDVQPDQREQLIAAVESASGVRPVLTPVVRGRLAAVNGVPVTRELVERRSHERRWFYTRDYVLTSMGTAPITNRLVRGTWWPEAPADRPVVSVEEEAANELGVDVGGRLAFDIQGVTVEAGVASIRRVDWQSLALNFFVIFSPGALDGAPTTYVGTARVGAGRESAVQDAVAAVLPNVTAIPVRDVLERVAAVLDQLAFAIRAIAVGSLASGLTVMLGALTASRYQRLYESVILRTIGATRATVARTFALEYGCLGAAAGLGGSLLAVLLAWVVLRFVLSVPWTFEPGAVVLGVLVTVATAVAVGFLATFRLLGAKPLAVLRQE